MGGIVAAWMELAGKMITDRVSRKGICKLLADQSFRESRNLGAFLDSGFRLSPE
jgi:hypothetical protein